jgi:glutathione S-transferase
MTTSQADKLYYARIPNGFGARAEMVRLVYVLAGKPYEDIVLNFGDVAAAIGGKNPFKQLPVVVTTGGEAIPQTMAIMHHVAHGTPAWPSDPAALTRALVVAQGAYDLYQAFGGFAADDLVAKKKFEERRAPQYFNALGEIYAKTPFAAGETPTFADCIAAEAVAWCVRRNEVCKGIFESNAGLKAFAERFEAVPAVKSFRARQAEKRVADNAL